MRSWIAGFMIISVGWVTQAGTATPQDRLADLESRLPTASENEKIGILNQMAANVVFRDGQRARELAEQALVAAESLGDRPGLATARKTRGLALMVLEEFPAALNEFEHAHELFLELENRSEAAKTAGYSGMMLAKLARTPEAIARVRWSLEVFRELGDEKGVAAASNNLGVYFAELGDYQQALQFNLESLAMEEALGRTIGIANNLNSIGNIYSFMGQDVTAKEYFLRAYPLFEQLDQPAGMSRVASNLGACSERLGDDNEALAHYARAVELARQARSLSSEANPLNNMGVILMKRGRSAEALDHFHKATEIRLQLGERTALVGSYHNIAEANLKMGRHSEALAALNEALAIARETQSNKSLAMVYQLLGMVHHELGNNLQAYQYERLHTEARNAMLDEQRTLAIAELQERFEAEKRQREIELLSKNNELLRLDAEVRRLALSRSRLIGGLAVATVALVIGIALVLFRRYLYLLAFWRTRTFVGQYRIEHEISRGGMGLVYRATSLVDPTTTVALKVIRDELASDPTLRQRFINEGRLIDGLKHPNIVKVLDRGEHNDRLYIAMEFLEGRSLARIIAEARKLEQHLPISRCLRLVSQLADALTAIHGRGILHRDITAANTIVIATGDHESVKLLDFGIAKLDTATTLTSAGELLGTISSMAPERIQLHAVTPASDIFSLGVLAYELLTLRKPFEAEEPVEVLKQILTLDPVAPVLLRPELGTELSDLIVATLHKVPERRPDGRHLLQGLTFALVRSS